MGLVKTGALSAVILEGEETGGSNTSLRVAEASVVEDPLLLSLLLIFLGTLCR